MTSGVRGCGWVLKPLDLPQALQHQPDVSPDLGPISRQGFTELLQEAAASVEVSKGLGQSQLRVEPIAQSHKHSLWRGDFSGDKEVAAEVDLGAQRGGRLLGRVSAPQMPPRDPQISPNST